MGCVVLPYWHTALSFSNPSLFSSLLSTARVVLNTVLFTAINEWNYTNSPEYHSFIAVAVISLVLVLPLSLLLLYYPCVPRSPHVEWAKCTTPNYTHTCSSPASQAFSATDLAPGGETKASVHQSPILGWYF